MLKVKEGNLFEEGDRDNLSSGKRQNPFDSLLNASLNDFREETPESKNSFHNLSAYGDPCQQSQAKIHSRNLNGEQNPRFFISKSVHEDYQ